MTNILDKEQFKKDLEGKSEYKLTLSNEDNIVDTLKTVFDVESELTTIPNIIIDLKSLSKDKLVEAIKYSLTREDLINSTMILNILNLIKIYNTLDDSFFNNEFVYFNNLTEMLDVKLTLKAELDDFITRLSIWYISLIHSMYKIEYSYLDKIEKLPKVFERIFLVSDFLTLSGIFSRTKEFSTKDLKMVENAYGYVSQLAQKSAIATAFMDKI